MTHIGQKHALCSVSRIGVSSRGVGFVDRGLQFGRHLVKGSREITNFSGISLRINAIGQITRAKSLDALFHSRQGGVGASDHCEDQCEGDDDRTDKADDSDLVGERNGAINDIGALHSHRMIDADLILAIVVGCRCRTTPIRRLGEISLIVTFIKVQPLVQ